MDENNPIVKFIKENFSSVTGFISVVILALTPLLGKTIIDRWTGRVKAEIGSIEQKTKDDNDNAVAGAAKTLIETTELVTKMYGDLNREQQEMYEARIKTLTAENSDLRKDIESVKERLGRQIKKLQDQVEMLRGEIAHVRAERDAYQGQLKENKIVPVIVPIMAGRKIE